jgi:hypothetical protein
MPAGRPPIFETVEQLDEAIHEYFTDGVKKRKVVIGKAPNQTIEEIEVPTITGLCYYIGFDSRQSFYDYENRPEFSYTIKRARLFIEREYEEQLSVGNTTGAIFALKNMGWKDKTEQEQYGKDGGPIQTENTLKVEVYDFSNVTQNK